MPLGALSKEYARLFFVLKDNSDDRLWTTYIKAIDFLICALILVFSSSYIYSSNSCNVCSFYRDK